MSQTENEATKMKYSDSGVSEEYAPGKWRPACPLPFYLRFGRCQCECGEKFRNEDRYRQHWGGVHRPGEREMTAWRSSSVFALSQRTPRMGNPR